MNKNTKIALAGLLSAAGSLLNAFAIEIGGADVPASPEAAAAPEAPKKGRKAAAAAVAATAEPAAQEAAVQAATPEPTEGGKTYEELRAMIQPLVKAGQGEDVKKVIAKYAANLKELETKPEHHAAFEKDLAALAY